MVDEVWLEAAAAVVADEDAEVRLEAAEVYVAEAARTRLRDLTGLVRIQVRCGRILVARCADEDAVDEHLVLAAGEGSSHASTLLVPLRAVIVVDGSVPGLPDELRAARPRSLASWLRECWSTGDVLRILDRSGHTHVGPLAMVAADHVRLESGRVIALRAVDAWWS